MLPSITEAVPPGTATVAGAIRDKIAALALNTLKPYSYQPLRNVSTELMALVGSAEIAVPGLAEKVAGHMETAYEAGQDMLFATSNGDDVCEYGEAWITAMRAIADAAVAALDAREAETAATR